MLQLGLSSDTLPEQQLYDLGNNFIRTQLATVQGASVPLPYGGKMRQIMVDLDPEGAAGEGLSPTDVVNAVNAQNLILPARHREDRRASNTTFEMNGSPRRVDGAQRPADQDGRTARRSTCATSRTCATATRRRPTSCARTASAPRC